MAIEETHKLRKELEKRDATVLGKEVGANVGDIASTVVPASELDELGSKGGAEGFGNDGVLVNWDADRDNAIIAIKVKKRTPILMAVFDNGAFAPKIHAFEGGEGLRVRSEIA